MSLVLQGEGLWATPIRIFNIFMVFITNNKNNPNEGMGSDRGIVVALGFRSLTCINSVTTQPLQNTYRHIVSTFQGTVLSLAITVLFALQNK